MTRSGLWQWQVIQEIFGEYNQLDLAPDWVLEQVREIKYWKISSLGVYRWQCHYQEDDRTDNSNIGCSKSRATKSVNPTRGLGDPLALHSTRNWPAMHESPSHSWTFSRRSTSKWTYWVGCNDTSTDTLCLYCQHLPANPHHCYSIHLLFTLLTSWSSFWLIWSLTLSSGINCKTRW